VKTIPVDRPTLGTAEIHHDGHTFGSLPGRDSLRHHLHKIALRSLALLALLTVFAVGAGAQVDTGSVQGQVADATGAVIPNALVTLRNENTGVAASMHTDAKGEFSFSPVRVGVYTITAEVQGFRREVQEHVQVDVQQELTVPLTLQPGSAQESVEVTAEAVPLLETQNASVGQGVSAQQINNLPLNGRNYYFLAQTAAGVTFAQNGSRGENGNGRFVANGLRATQNDYLLDEIDNNSSIVSVQNGKDFVIQTSVDALADFKIQTNNYNAEFGRAAGAVLNATIKSGTNGLHGDVWEFLRNDVLDANDYFLNHAGKSRTEFKRNQFGFTLGGPVLLPHIYNGRNKTFFFGDYEGTRSNQGNAIAGTVPTTLERSSGFTNFSDLISLQSGNDKADAAGNVYPLGTILDPATTAPFGSSYVRTPFPGNIIPASRIDPNAVALLNLLPPPTFTTLANNYITAPTNVDNYNNFDIRIDQVIGGKDYLFGRYSYNAHTQNHPGIFTNYQNGYADGGNSSSLSNFFDRAQNVSIGETHTFSPRLVNDLRIGLNREHVLWLQPNGNTLGIPAKFGIQGVPQYPTNGGLPEFYVGSLTSFGSFNYLPSNKYGTTPQLNDDLTIVRGEHTIKFGIEQQFIQFPYTQPPQSRGAFTFGGTYTSVYGQTDGTTGIAQMLLNPTSTSNLAGANSIAMSTFVEHGLTHKYFGAYAQDDWRVTHKLTLNIGLRYDSFDFMHEQHDNIANFIPGPGRVGGTYLATSKVYNELSSSFLTALSSEGITTQSVGQGSLVSVQHLNFAPRVGFAYQATNRLVVRGGYGIFYGGIEDIGGSPLVTENFPIEYDITRTATNAATPLAANNSLGLLESSFVNLAVAPSTVNPAGLALIGFQKNAETPYSEGYNLSLQYQLNQSMALTADYVGDTSRHIETVLGLNSVSELLPPTATTTPYVPYPATALSGDDLTITGASSSFNAGQITLEQRPAHGLTLLTNFAFQKTLTDARDPLEGTTGSYRAPFLPNFGIQADKEHADFDVKSIFHFSGTYDLPFGAGRTFGAHVHGIEQATLGGWSTNFIATAQDGQPFTVACSVTTAAGAGCNALLVPGQSPYANSSVAHFVNAAAFANPAAVTTVGQTDYSPLGGRSTQVAGPPFRRIDISFFKQFNFTERFYSEFRAELFNITNTANFANPSSLNFSNTTSFGQITATRDSPNDPREVQFALKIYW
jgi:hypothetical protein